MEKNIIDEILAETKSTLEAIFKNEMLFGFVCGGFSKGYADENHDVDIFVCLNNDPAREIERRYLKWYFDLHKRYRLKPDYDYPGEIVTYNKLVKSLEMLKNFKLTLKINSIRIKEAIIWADMITGKTVAETGRNLNMLHVLKIKYSKYPERWKKEILALISKDEREEWKDKDLSLIMEYFMKYPKNDVKSKNRV